MRDYVVVAAQNAATAPAAFALQHNTHYRTPRVHRLSPLRPAPLALRSYCSLRSARWGLVLG